MSLRIRAGLKQRTELRRRSRQFFEALGFEFADRFSNENAACVVFNDNAFAMLLGEPFFRRFIDDEVADPGQGTGRDDPGDDRRTSIRRQVEEGVLRAADEPR